MSVDHDHDPDASMERWTFCWFCGAAMRLRAARLLPTPFSALPLPACPDCVQAREQAHSAHGVHSSAHPQEAK